MLARRLVLSALLLALSFPAHAFDFGSLLSGWIEFFNRKVSALKVVTKQRAVASEKVANSAREATSALATSYVANRQAQLTRETFERFSDQGVFPCYQGEIAMQVARTTANVAIAEQDAAARMQAANYGNETERKALQIQLHRAVYCSVSEHKAGLCKVTAMGMQSADVDFSFLIRSGTKGPSERKAGYDFIDNIVPVRKGLVCNTSECQAQQFNVRTLNTADSLARNSLLSFIEARSVQNR